MSLTKAQCPNCGGILEVESSKESAVCPFCNTPYIVEKAINNYYNEIKIENATINVLVGNINNLLIRANSFEEKGDVEKATEYYNRVLDIDATNEAAIAALERLDGTSAKKELEEAIIGEIRTLLSSGKKLDAIKKVRAITGCGLKDAKDAVESFAAGISPTPFPLSSSSSSSNSDSGGGCYVATAVYGSYDCPEVWTLRRFRDDTLASTRRGRAFIRTYYAISPTLVKWFGDTQWFNAICRSLLDRLVSRLNAEGVDNTPYNDKQ